MIGSSAVNDGTSLTTMMIQSKRSIEGIRTSNEPLVGLVLKGIDRISEPSL